MNAQRVPETRTFVAGLDLGQSRDFTALVILERIVVGRPIAPIQTVGEVTFFGLKDRRPGTYHVRHIERPALGTLYPDIVRRVGELLATPPLTKATPLAVDRTGVGAPICDLFKPIAPGLHAITITGGDKAIRDGRAHTKVPKRLLVSELVRLFQTDRLKIAEELELASALTRELLNFRMKVDLATGHDSYEAWRESDHDDIVLATALAVWLGENPARSGAGATLTWG